MREKPKPGTPAGVYKLGEGEREGQNNQGTVQGLLYDVRAHTEDTRAAAGALPACVR